MKLNWFILQTRTWFFFNTSFGVQGGGFIIIETKLNFVEHFIKLTFFIEIIKKFRLEKLIKCLLIL